MTIDVLPDCRTRVRTGALVVDGIEYVPVYCGNCGKRYGLVPAKLITHVFALCDDGCAGKLGDLAHTYVDADAPFRANAAEAVSKVVRQLGRPVTAAELARLAAEPASPLAAVARDWQARISKEK